MSDSKLTNVRDWVEAHRVSEERIGPLLAAQHRISEIAMSDLIHRLTAEVARQEEEGWDAPMSPEPPRWEPRYCRHLRTGNVLLPLAEVRTLLARIAAMEAESGAPWRVCPTCRGSNATPCGRCPDIAECNAGTREHGRICPSCLDCELPGLCRCRLPRRCQMKLADRVICQTCLWPCERDDPQPLPCRHWTDAETGETVADLALAIRLARARAERCAGCAIWDAEDGRCHRLPQGEVANDTTPSEDWCGEWQPGQPGQPAEEAPDA